MKRLTTLVLGMALISGTVATAIASAAPHDGSGGQAPKDQQTNSTEQRKQQMKNQEKKMTQQQKKMKKIQNNPSQKDKTPKGGQ